MWPKHVDDWRWSKGFEVRLRISKGDVLRRPTALKKWVFLQSCQKLM